MKFFNPILRGFNPDPSICRVGQDYYLVTSTFEFYPGIPIYHSRDLVNWTQIGSCVDRPDMLPFDAAPVGRGIWAPTIRYHNDRYYVTAKFMEHGNFIIHAEDPAGPWSDPVLVEIGGIDPSILFDGGKAYYCTNARPEGVEACISLAEIDVDTGALLSDIRPIWNGMSADRPQYLEASHIYHIGDWYYLLAAKGGTGFEHMITAARSRDIWGPYEDCPFGPLLTNRYTENGVACSGHGDLLEDARGNWWCVHLATRPDDRWYSHLGRESFLLPVTWDAGWPRIASGVSTLEVDAPIGAAQTPLAPFRADLTRIDAQWLFLRHPVQSSYLPGQIGMTLRPSAVTLEDEMGSPTLMAVRQMDIHCTVEAHFTFSPVHDGDEAGLTVFISCAGHYRFGRTRTAGQDCIIVAKNGEEPQLFPCGDASFTLHIAADKHAYHLAFTDAAGDRHPLCSIPVLTRVDAGKCFTGTLLGVYAQCRRATDACAILDRFVMQAL